MPARVTVRDGTSLLRTFLDSGWRQPDQRSCGACVLVLAETLRNEGYARSLDERGTYSREVLAMHRRVTGAVDVRQRLQLPWPRGLGTPPWAVVRQLRGRTGIPYRTVVGPRSRLYDRLLTASHDGHPAVLYVGSQMLPRHVLLVVPHALTTAGADDLVVHDPADGHLRTLPRDDFLGGTLTPGWPRPWCAVVPVTPGS